MPYVVCLPQPVVFTPGEIEAWADSRWSQMNIALPEGKYLMVRPSGGISGRHSRATFEQLLAVMRQVVGDRFEEVRLRGPAIWPYLLGALVWVSLLAFILLLFAWLTHMGWPAY
jgi:hypothetical protein